MLKMLGLCLVSRMLDGQDALCPGCLVSMMLGV